MTGAITPMPCRNSGKTSNLLHQVFSHFILLVFLTNSCAARLRPSAPSARIDALSVVAVDRPLLLITDSLAFARLHVVQPDGKLQPYLSGLLQPPSSPPPSLSAARLLQTAQRGQPFIVQLVVQSNYLNLRLWRVESPGSTRNFTLLSASDVAPVSKNV